MKPSLPLKTGCSWSGGKDSCYALMLAKDNSYLPSSLLTVLNEEGKISRSHGIPAEILSAQAASANLPICLLESSWADYEVKFTKAIIELKNTFQLSEMVFGDIDLDEHRQWEEKVCKKAGLNALLPLWKQDRNQLIVKMLEAGIETMIVSCNTHLGEKFLGKILNLETIRELEKAGVDVCGENGEFHTLVLNCPLFSKRIVVDLLSKKRYEDYWFCELVLADK